MRVGLVCPYSLTMPGGVQGQVLGLGRALRGMGHEARVLGPCDGPPPDVAVTPLGDCVPLAAKALAAAVVNDCPPTLQSPLLTSSITTSVYGRRFSPSIETMV